MKRLGLIHTVPFLAEMFKARLAEKYPELSAFHVVDESLLQELLGSGGLTPGVIRRIAVQASLAQEAGAEMILFTCSSTSPAVDTVRKLVDIPILKIDDPMAEKAVKLGRRIGVICTASSTVEASEALIRDHAARQNKEVEVLVRLESPAFEAIMSGDKDRHDELVQQAALEQGSKCDVVVLAQASMAHLVPELTAALDVPVLAGPDLCVEALSDLL